MLKPPLIDQFYKPEEILELSKNLTYCGPSPDEIALLLASKDSFKFFFTGADTRKVVIQTLNLKIEVQKLLSFPFDSSRKMMSVMVRFNNKGRLG